MAQEKCAAWTQFGTILIILSHAVTVEYLALITPHSNGCIEKVYAIANNNKPLFLSFSIFGQFSS